MAPTVPDALTKQERVSMLEGHLQNLQREAFAAQLARTSAGLGDGDQSPYAGPDGQPLTFGDHQKRLKAAQEQLVADHSDLLDEVRKRIRNRQEAEEAAAEPAGG